MPLHVVDVDLEWLLTIAPGLLGLRSTHGGIVAAREGGGLGAYDSSVRKALARREGRQRCFAYQGLRCVIEAEPTQIALDSLYSSSR